MSSFSSFMISKLRVTAKVDLCYVTPEQIKLVGNKEAAESFYEYIK